MDTFPARIDTTPESPEFPPLCPICRTRMVMTERVKTVYLLACEGCETKLHVPLRALKEWSL